MGEMVRVLREWGDLGGIAGSPAGALVKSDIYPAMLCIAPTMLLQDVCPLSYIVWIRFPIMSYRLNVSNCSPLGSHTILVFLYKNFWQYSDFRRGP